MRTGEPLRFACARFTNCGHTHTAATGPRGSSAFLHKRVDGLIGAGFGKIGEIEAAQGAHGDLLHQTWDSSATKDRMRRLNFSEASAAVSLVS